MVQATGADEKAAQAGDQQPDMGLHVVWTGGDDSGADPRPELLLSPDDNGGQRAVGVQDGGEEERAGGGARGNAAA